MKSFRRSTLVLFFLFLGQFIFSQTLPGTSIPGSSLPSGSIAPGSSSASPAAGTAAQPSLTGSPTVNQAPSEVSAALSAQEVAEKVEDSILPITRTIPRDLSSIERMIASSVPESEPVLRQYGYDFFIRQVSPTTTSVGDDYHLGPGDVLIAYLWGDPVDIRELPQQFELVVDRNGSVFVPSVGQLTVWGEELGTVRKLIKSALDRKFRRLEMSLTLSTLREFPVSVAGFVNKPGTIMATAVDTLFDVVSRAGGVMKTGSLRDIKLTRKGSSPITIDLYDILIFGRQVDVRVKEGDAILIPGIGTVAAVAGAVRRPAVYELKGSANVRDLLTFAGGVLPSAFEEKISLVRIHGQQRSITDGALKDSLFSNSQIMDGDVVAVPFVKEYIENLVFVEGWVKFPDRYELRQGVTLRRIINLAQVLTDTNLYFATVKRVGAGGKNLNFTFAPQDILAGETDFVLENQDIITFYQAGIEPENFLFNDFIDTIVLKGPVRYPGVYAWDKGRMLSDLLNKSQLLPETNVFYAQILGTKENARKRTLTFSPRDIIDGIKDIPLEPLDTIQFFKMGEEPKTISLDEFPETVFAQGYVRYPGPYAWSEGFMLSNFLKKMELSIQADTKYAVIQRTDNQGNISLQDFVPERILMGEYDMVLQARDRIVISLRRIYSPVMVSGEIQDAKALAYYPGMTLIEALRSVKLKEDARNLKAIITRQEGEQELHYLYDILVKSGTVNILLQAGDKVNIQKLLPDERADLVLVRGEVVFPQAIEYWPGMRLSDALSIAGDLTSDAYLPGVVVIRKSIASAQKQYIDKLIASIQTTQQKASEDYQIAKTQAQSGEGAEIAALNASLMLAAQEAELTRLQELYQSSLGRISIEPPQYYEQLKGSAGDIILEKDDMIFVPKMPNYIMILGESMNQITISYTPGIKVRDALDAAGWISPDADLTNAYIVRANGRLESARKKNFYIFAPTLLKWNLSPGDTIYIPRKPQKYSTALPVLRDVVQIVGQLISSAVSTVALMRTFE